MQPADHLSLSSPRPAQPLIRYNNTYRDAVQCLMGTSPSAEELVAAHPNAAHMGFSSMQTCGGTFFDIVARKGRLPGPFVETINAAYPDITKSALFRNEFTLGYEPYSYDTIKTMVYEHARAGVKVFQNYHGLNDTRYSVAVAQAAQEINAETGWDLEARASICIEDNSNITIESCMQAARELIASGHKGFYLKCASGRVKADFAGELAGRLLDEFPDQSLDAHIHDTYGEADPAYEAVVKAAVSRGRSVGLDVQHTAIAGNTAQPCMLKTQDWIEHHPDPQVRANAPVLDYPAIEADMDSLLELRARYGGAETRYNPRLLDAMYKARAPGGATATLRGIPGLEKNLAAVLGTNDWDEIQIAVYEMQAKILPRLGDPTQVTPFAFVTTKEAAFAVLREKMGKDPLADITNDTAFYLAGGLGKVPESVDPALVARALNKLNLAAPIDHIDPKTRDSAMDKARKILAEKRVEEPDNWDLLTVACTGDGTNRVGEALIADKYAGRLAPVPVPEFPVMKHVRPAALGGIAAADNGLGGSWIKASAEGNGRVQDKIDDRMDANLFAALGGVAAFEAVAQKSLEVHRAQRPTRYALEQQKTISPYLAERRAVWLESAKAAVEGFSAQAAAVLASERNVQAATRGYNRVVKEVCAAKGNDSAVPLLDPRTVRAFAFSAAQGAAVQQVAQDGDPSQERG